MVLNPVADKGLERFLEAMHLFSMGFSWGGFESLVIPCDQQLTRMKGSWTDSRAGPLLRFHIGLEAVDDLVADLTTGFAAMTGN